MVVSEVATVLFSVTDSDEADGSTVVVVLVVTATICSYDGETGIMYHLVVQVLVALAVATALSRRSVEAKCTTIDVAISLVDIELSSRGDGIAILVASLMACAMGIVSAIAIDVLAVVVVFGSLDSRAPLVVAVNVGVIVLEESTLVVVVSIMVVAAAVSVLAVLLCV
jgi:hypothetical protein